MLILGSWTVTKLNCTVCFRVPDRQRSSLVVRINLPRLMNNIKVNPNKFKQRSVFITIPAFMISPFKDVDLADSCKLHDSGGFDTECQGFYNRLNESHPLGIFSIQARAAYISSGDIPALGCHDV